MRRRSAGARAGNALAARGQRAGSAWAARGSDLALWRARIRRLHGFCESGIHLPSNGFPTASSSSHYVAGRSVVAARPDFGGFGWHTLLLPYWHATAPRLHPPLT